MLRVGLIGIGCMGRTHLKSYLKLESEGFPVKLVSICDIDKEKFEGKFKKGNVDPNALKYDLSKYSLYTDIDEMLEKERLDYVDIALPTFLHAIVSVKALNLGIHVLCEKPIALNSADCDLMIDAVERNNRKLMIAQCLRFWPEYEYLKECVESNKFGKVTGGYFFRGGGTPIWSYENWLMHKEKSGSCILDQHIHDVDTINWLFGKPDKVSTIASNVIPGSGYDILSTNYYYEDGKVINAQDDWTLNGEYKYQMLFRVNFERGNLVYQNGTLTVNPNDDKQFIPELPGDKGYYFEIKYFANAVIKDTDIKTASPKSTKETIEIAEAEVLSADQKGQWVTLK